MRILAALIVVSLAVVVTPAQSKDRSKPLKPFKTDNCTMFPDGDYADCCVEHDREYWMGGTLKQRSESDKKLKKCVMSKGRGWKRKLLANVMWVGVRIGGVHFLPTPFRWGFGHKWPQKGPKPQK